MDSDTSLCHLLTPWSQASWLNSMLCFPSHKMGFRAAVRIESIYTSIMLKTEHAVSAQYYVNEIANIYLFLTYHKVSYGST